MNVAFITSEIAPFSKTGGLGDVSYSLPVNLKKNGINIIVITPLYKTINREKFNIKDLSLEFSIYIDNNVEKVRVFQAEIDNLMVYFIDNNRFFNVENFYEGESGIRFGFFCWGVIELLKRLNFHPDVIHINDWQTGILPVILKVRYADDTFFSKTKILLTIHNLAYQGYFPKEILLRIGLPDYLFNIEMLEFYGQVNFLKGGIVFSDFITTVSPTYAKEILTPEAGWGLDGVLRNKKDKIKGILNGIDEELWNPEKDKLIYKNYGINSLQNKIYNKLFLQRKLNFKEDKDIILYGFVGRLTYQKGFEFIVNLIPHLSNFKVQIIILGTGEKYYENMILKIADKYKDFLKLYLKFDEELAHQIYAGIDFLLMPSVYEPCGLTQMISLKYGSIPIARKVGGLNDSIIDISEDNHKPTGILFKNLDLNEFFSSVVKSFELFYKNRNFLKQMQIKGMNSDFSWNRSCKEYIELYKRLKT